MADNLRMLMERMHQAARAAAKAGNGKAIDWYRDMSSLKAEATLYWLEDAHRIRPFGKIQDRNYEAISEHISWNSPNNVLAMFEYLGQLEMQVAALQQEGSKTKDAPEETSKENK